MQQNREALRSVGFVKPRGGEDDIPYLVEKMEGTLPFEGFETQAKDWEESDTVYVLRSWHHYNVILCSEVGCSLSCLALDLMIFWQILPGLPESDA